MKFFRRNKPQIQDRGAPVDPSLLAKDRAEADKLHVTAERQAFTAKIAVNELRQVNLRNGFAPAIEDSVRRKLRNIGEAT